MSSTKRKFKIGDIVKHFKREFVENPFELNYLYEIIEFAIHTETGEKMVVYRSLYKNEKGEHECFVIPYNMFIAKIDNKKYPVITQKYVFEKYE